jgi:hypothetical protein
MRSLFPNSDKKVDPKFERVPVRRNSQVIEGFSWLWEHGFIAGSYAATSSLSGSHEKNGVLNFHILNTPSDIDIFCFNEDSETHIDQGLLSMGYSLFSDNEMVATYVHSDDSFSTVQLVMPRILSNGVTFGTAEEVIDSFDYTVCRAAIISNTEIVRDTNLSEDYSVKRLRLMNSNCPVGAMLRYQKYSKKGFVMDYENVLDLVRFAQDNPLPDDKVEKLLKLSRVKNELHWIDNDKKSAYIESNGLTPEEVDDIYKFIKVD